MNKIKTDGIIFDMDGTVWDNTPLFAKSWQRAIREHGYDVEITADTLKGLFGKTMKDIADACIPDEVPQNRYKTLDDCEKYEMDDLVKSGENTSYEGLEETLKSLSLRTNLYIVSNCQSGYIETFYDLTGYGKYFKDFICYGDNGLGKSDNLRVLIDKNQIKNPVYIGDIQGDKDACDKAGVPFIWAAYGYGKEVDDYIAKIDNIKQLDEIID